MLSYINTVKNYFSLVIFKVVNVNVRQYITLKYARNLSVCDIHLYLQLDNLYSIQEHLKSGVLAKDVMNDL